jgi:CheY-like chemotaxis protein
VLKRLRSPDPKTELHHAIIERQTRYLSRLVDDLLDLNRIAYGKLELRPEVASLQSPVTFAIESSHGAFAEKGVDLVLDLAEQPIVVFADSTRVSQVVMNLLANALKFTPAGGRVTVSLQAVGSEAVVRVSDTGAGIPAELLPRVFEPFEQADTSLAHGSGGLGIGLMIARGLVESQGGKIEAHSDGAERGAEFVVRFPLSLSEPAAPNGLIPEPDSVNPRRIALIEDNEDAREALATALRLVGHEVFVGATAEEALELARTETPDTFILDIGLPGIDGYKLAKALRANSESQNATLIALTGYGMDADRDRAREAGFNHHLTKPVDVEVLTKLLGAPATST